MTRPRRAVAVAVGAALALAGCAGVPDSGPVSRVEAVTLEDEPLVYDPPPPEPGASQFEIAQGFYTAMLVYPFSTKDAEAFLTEPAREDWEPARRTVIYENEVRARQLGPGVVGTWVRKLGGLDARGRYRAAPPGQVDEASRLTMRLEGGEWRIADPPNVLYVDSYFFSRYYDPYSLYFIGPSGNTVVPEPIYLPLAQQPYTQQTATALVRQLLGGPARGWHGQLATALPRRTELDGSVSLTRDDVAVVRLVGPIIDLSPEAQRLLLAQLVLTLGQLPGLDGVRILVDGVALKVPGVPAIQRPDQWSTFDPSRSPTPGQLYGLRSGKLVQVLPRRGPVTLSGSLWGTERQGIRSFDIDVNLERVLAVSADGRRLLSGRLYQSEQATPRTVYVGGADLATPVDATSVDATSTDDEPPPQLLVVDRHPDGTSSLLVSDGRQVQQARMGGLERNRVEFLSLSPDGMRFVALTRAATPTGLGARRIVTGRVVRSADGLRVVGLVDPRELVVSDSPLRDIRSVGWFDATTLAVLCEAGGSTTTLDAVTVRVDGSELTTEWFVREPIREPTRLLTSVGADRRAYLVDKRRRLWVEDDGEWVQTGAVGLDALNFAG